MLRARYSPQAARGAPLLLDLELTASLRPAAAQLIRAVRLGRSRRLVPRRTGGRFDLRRTLRASLETGGDPIDLRFLGRPPCSPRFVVLIDGSRSMSEYNAAVVAFAAALCERTPRADVFVFSTALRDVTREIRAAARTGVSLADVGDAWGGGTKIGASLARFVADHGARLLSPDTLVLIASDGLDAGDLGRLERAMREIERRAAGIVWLNPHVATPGYSPAAGGMRMALRSIGLLAAAHDARSFGALVERIRRTPRVRGRR